MNMIVIHFHQISHFSILLYAVRWNKLQEDVSARKALLDSWRQVLILRQICFYKEGFAKLLIFKLYQILNYCLLFYNLVSSGCRGAPVLLRSHRRRPHAELKAAASPRPPANPSEQGEAILDQTELKLKLSGEHRFL